MRTLFFDLFFDENLEYIDSLQKLQEGYYDLVMVPDFERYAILKPECKTKKTGNYIYGDDRNATKYL